jgi:hypothetical protein
MRKDDDVAPASAAKQDIHIGGYILRNQNPASRVFFRDCGLKDCQNWWPSSM